MTQCTRNLERERSLPISSIPRVSYGSRFSSGEIMSVSEPSRAQMASEVPEILVDPKTLRSYGRDELLGQGACGKCYKMTDLETGDTYAVKVIRLYSWGVEEVCEEVQILKTLRHKNVVGFSHSFEDDKFMYIFMELCSGQTLGDILKARGTLTEPEVRYYINQLISGLTYIHWQGYVHRDIKLENLFINDQMELKIGDFGLAVKLKPREKEVCGTPVYMAPEVWKREGHGREADVWALGCVMYQLLVGEIAFYDDNYWEMLKNIKEAKFILPQNLSIEAGKLMGKIFRIDPRDRPSLSNVRRHKFFTKGFTPKTLPASSCNTPPKHKSVNPFKKIFNRFMRLIRKKRSRVEPLREDAEQSGLEIPQPVESLRVLEDVNRPMNKLTWSSWSKWLRDL
ncbi:serine/threonine-protein kinase PLK3-like [Brienomyrus brachyistius]|uniref:serine/threonine-protein kinase PLK3-like n=1 Tax=Brienomyrus brachyistius TaxID=42636 RepID=UPI0020B21A71|nr:serine/threonine-protein kinase PLK3-like [Brienomyrus brachyistius]